MAENDPSLRVPPDNPPGHELQGLDPAELLARGLNTVRFSGTFGDWAPPAPEDLARLLPQYHIEAMLGHGGMGAVYKGFQADLDRPVAIKLLPAELSADEQFVTRFKREARTLARLHHPGIVSVYDFGQTSKGHLYFVMEYVDGTDLRRILKSPGLNPEQALELVGQICEALQAAHKQGVIHRDIKPANILLTSDGSVKLADFGLSRPLLEEDTGGITLSHQVMGTMDYMSPEQRSGHSDHRTDIYALGITLYEMLTGKCPRGVFVPPSRKVQVDVRIDEVVIKALQDEPDLRYQQASEMKTDVDHIRTSAVQPAPPVFAPLKPARPPRRMNMNLVIALNMALVLAVIAALYIGLGNGGEMVRQRLPSIWALFTKPATEDRGVAAATPKPQPVAQPNPMNAEQALTSSLWSVANDSNKPATNLYYPDGTGKGPWIGTEHWIATGERTFNLNGTTPCVFNETFTRFIGHWTDEKNKGHTETGVRLETGPIHFISARVESTAAYRFDVTATVLASLRAGQRKIPTTNEYFGFDARPGWGKRYFFVLSCESGQFQLGARGGETLTIPDTLPAKAVFQSPADPPPAQPLIQITQQGTTRSSQASQPAAQPASTSDAQTTPTVPAPAPPAAPGPAPDGVVATSGDTPDVRYSTGFEQPQFNVGPFGPDPGSGTAQDPSHWSLFAGGNGADLANEIRIANSVVRSGAQALLIDAASANGVQSGVSASFENTQPFVTIQADVRLQSSSKRTVWQFVAIDKTAPGGFVGGFNIAPEFQHLVP